MKNTRKAKLIIFLQRNQIQFIETGGGFNGELPVSETAIKDLEVVDASAFSTEVRDYVEKNKIGACDALIVLSDSIVFIKEVSISEKDTNGLYIQDFTDNVPLEAPEVKTFMMTNLVRVVAVNPKIYEVIGEAMKARGFSILGVIPFFVFQKLKEMPMMDVSTAKYISDNYDSVSTQSFITPIEKISEPVITNSTPKGGRVYILIGIFVLGIFILVYLLTRPA